MRLKQLFVVCGLGVAAALGGCAAGDGLGLTTASLETPAKPPARAKPSIDPACVELAARINAARAEGTPERVAKVADGQGRTATIKRASLAKVAELDAMNQEFMTRCSVVANSPDPVATVAAAPSAESRANPADPILDPPRTQ